MTIDVRDYEGAAGDVDRAGCGPIFITRGDVDVIRARCSQRGSTLEITDVEILDARLEHRDVVELIEKVYLISFTDDYYRDTVDTIALTFVDGPTITFAYPT